MLDMTFTERMSARLINSVRSLVVAGAVAAMAVVAAPEAKANTEAEEFVKKLSGDTIALIADTSKTEDERKEDFRKLFMSNADFKRIAGFALGNYIKLPTNEQRKEYLQLLEDYIVNVYFTRLDDYNDEKITVSGSTEKSKKDIIVHSQVEFTNGRDPIAVNWWIRKSKDGSYKLFDLNAVGVWMVQEQRAAFSSVISKNGGQFEALLDHLRTGIATGAVVGEEEEAGGA